MTPKQAKTKLQTAYSLCKEVSEAEPELFRFIRKGLCAGDALVDIAYSLGVIQDTEARYAEAQKAERAEYERLHKKYGRK